MDRFEMCFVCGVCGKEIWNQGFIKEVSENYYRLVCGSGDSETTEIEFECYKCGCIVLGKAFVHLYVGKNLQRQTL